MIGRLRVSPSRPPIGDRAQYLAARPRKDRDLFSALALPSLNLDLALNLIHTLISFGSRHRPLDLTRSEPRGLYSGLCRCSLKCRETLAPPEVNHPKRTPASIDFTPPPTPLCQPDDVSLEGCHALG